MLILPGSSAWSPCRETAVALCNLHAFGLTLAPVHEHAEGFSFLVGVALVLAFIVGRAVFHVSLLDWLF
jgi:hypothetical protein